MMPRKVVIDPSVSLSECKYLAGIKAWCKERGEPFSQWCERRGYHYDQARKLAKIGEAPDPAAALEHHRHRNKIANRKFRT